MKISYSHSSGIRSCCKWCGTGPNEGYPFPGRVAAANPLVPLLIKSKIWKTNEIVKDHYLIDDPKNFTTIQNYSIKINFNKMGIRYHQYYDINDSFQLNNMAYLCRCHKTCWILPKLERKHIYNRKCQKSLPLKIKSY